VYKQLGDVEGVLPMLENYDMDRVNWREEKKGDAQFARSVKETRGNSPYDLTKYRHAFVFPLADRTLEGIRTHEQQTKKGWMRDKELKQQMLEVGNCLKNFHNRNVMHGDLCAKKILRVSGKLTLMGLDKCSTIPSDYVGYRASRTALYPPEMLVVLDGRQVEKYEQYFKVLKEDHEIYKSTSKQLGKDEIDLLADKVDDYVSMLEEASGGSTENQARFDDLWSRIAENAETWSRIRPRRNKEGGVVVPKVFRNKNSTKVPLHPELLPYKPLKASVSQDMWTFGLLLFRQYSKLNLFRCTSELELISDEDYCRLANWSENDGFELIDENNVEDPVLRDLLRKLLAREEDRLKSTEEVFQHAFFDELNLEKVDMLRYQVVHLEDTRKKREEEIAHVKKDHEKWIQRRTKFMKFMSTDTVLKLTRSTSSQWKGICSSFGNPSVMARDFLCPTSFVILPYKLDKNGQATDKALAKHFAVLLGEALHFTTMAGLIVQNTEQKQMPSIELFAEYLQTLEEVNSQSSAYHGSSTNSISSNATHTMDPASIVNICEWMIMRTANAEQVLGDILAYYMPSSDVRDPNTSMAHVNAEKIIRDFVSRFIDMDVCHDIVNKATVAQKAFAKLIENVVPDGTSTAKRIVHEKLGSLIDMDLAKKISISKPCLEEGLLDIIKAFAEDMIGASVQVLTEKVVKLVDAFPENGYMYFLDEYDGSLVVDVEGASYYPFKLAKKQVTDFLPAMRLGAKCACATNMVAGLRKITGLTNDEIDPTWENLARNVAGNWEQTGAVAEYNLFYEIIHGSPSERRQVYAELDLERVEKFVLDNDRAKEYAGLKRILAPDNKTSLWTLDHNEDTIDQDIVKTLIDFANEKETEAMNDQMSWFDKLKPKLSPLDANTIQEPCTAEDLADQNEETASSASSTNTKTTEIVHPVHLLQKARLENPPFYEDKPDPKQQSNKVVYEQHPNPPQETNATPPPQNLFGRKFVTVNRGHTRDLSWDMSTITMHEHKLEGREDETQLSSPSDDLNPTTHPHNPHHQVLVESPRQTSTSYPTPVANNTRANNSNGFFNHGQTGYDRKHHEPQQDANFANTAGLWSSRFKQQPPQVQPDYESYDMQDRTAGINQYQRKTGAGIVSSRTNVYEKNSWAGVSGINARLNRM